MRRADALRCWISSCALLLAALTALEPTAGAQEGAREVAATPAEKTTEDPDLGAASRSGSITHDDPLIDSEPLDRVLRGVFVDPIRLRYEWRKDLDCRSDLGDHDTYTVFKIGAGIDAHPIDEVGGRIELRLTRSWDRDVVARRARFDAFGQDQLDVYEAYGEVMPFEAVPIGARVGRQRLVLGEERLFGTNDFVQNSRSWDMGRFLVRGDDVDVDAFWGRSVRFEGYDDHNVNKPTDTVDVFGVYGSVRLLDDALTVEPFYIGKFDDNRVFLGESGELGHRLLVHSPGARAVWKVLPFTFWGDAVVQWGDFGPDQILAYGFVAKAAWRSPEWLRPLFELETEFVYGSGDTDPDDGRHGTFDNFFGSNHKLYGEIDLTSWQNIQQWRLTSRFELYRVKLHEKPPKLEDGAPPRYVWQRAEESLAPHEMPFHLEIGWYFFWLASPSDTWFSANQTPLRRDRTGQAPRELGGELDIMFKIGGLTVGAAHFFRGAYVDRTTPSGGHAADAQFFYVEYAAHF